MNDYFDETSKTQMNWKEFSNTFSKEELYDLKNVVIQDFCKAFKDNDIAIKSILENFSQIILRYNLPDNTLWFDVFVSKNSCK